MSPENTRSPAAGEVPPKIEELITKHVRFEIAGAPAVEREIQFKPVQEIPDRRQLRTSVLGRAQELHGAEAQEGIATSIYLPDELITVEHGADGRPVFIEEGKEQGQPRKILSLEPEQPLKPDEPIRVAVFLHAQTSFPGSKANVIETARQAGHAVIASTTSRKSRWHGDPRRDAVVRATHERYGNDKKAWERDSFEGKGFQDEEEDFLRGALAGLDILRQRYGDHPIELALIGHSYGGTIAADLAETLRPNRLVLLAPSLRMLDRTPSAAAAGLITEDEVEVALGDSPPSKEEVLQRAQSAKEVTVIRGANDKIISREDCEKYAGLYGKPHGAVSMVEGGIIPHEDGRLLYTGREGQVTCVATPRPEGEGYTYASPPPNNTPMDGPPDVFYTGPNGEVLAVEKVGAGGEQVFEDSQGRPLEQSPDIVYTDATGTIICIGTYEGEEGVSYRAPDGTPMEQPPVVVEDSDPTQAVPEQKGVYIEIPATGHVFGREGFTAEGLGETGIGQEHLLERAVEHALVSTTTSTGTSASSEQ